MPRVLTAEQVRAFRDDGYLFPLRVLDAETTLVARDRLERFEVDTGKPLAGKWTHKSHLVLTSIAELVRDQRILDAVEDLLGPDILCWNTDLFIKRGASDSFVSWHQDSTYWGLEPADVVTAWVALTLSDDTNGAVRVIPRSHTRNQLAHVDTFAADNLLTRGQEIAVEVDAAEAVTLTLAPGEMSLHHVRLVHGSAPNRSGEPRIGVAIRYLPTHVRQRAGEDSATLVRGEDLYRNFELEPRPRADLDDAAVAYHRMVLARTGKIVNPVAPAD